jgi:hypothetical protein
VVLAVVLAVTEVSVVTPPVPDAPFSSAPVWVVVGAAGAVLADETHHHMPNITRMTMMIPTTHAVVLLLSIYQTVILY